MKKFIAFTLLSIMFIITGENECEQYNSSRETCESAHADDIFYLITYNFKNYFKS